jgi:hypothetical protein
MTKRRNTAVRQSMTKRRNTAVRQSMTKRRNTAVRQSMTKRRNTIKNSCLRPDVFDLGMDQSREQKLKMELIKVSMKSALLKILSYLSG